MGGCSGGGVSAPGGVCSQRGGGLFPGGCLLLGGCLFQGVSAPGGCLLPEGWGSVPRGGVCSWGLSVPGGVCSWGVSAPRGCLVPGAVVSQHALRQTHP